MRFLVLLLCAGLLPAAQHTGIVRSGGFSIPGASVTATQGTEKLVTTTDESGTYRFEKLEPGHWDFEAQIFGFAIGVNSHRFSEMAITRPAASRQASDQAVREVWAAAQAWVRAADLLAVAAQVEDRDRATLPPCVSAWRG